MGEHDKDRGLYGKFNVTRTDGSSNAGGKHADCEHFVLDMTHDKFASTAMLAYADACEAEYPQLARDLRDRIIAMERTPMYSPTLSIDFTMICADVISTSHGFSAEEFEYLQTLLGMNVQQGVKTHEMLVDQNIIFDALRKSLDSDSAFDIEAAIVAIKSMCGNNPNVYIDMEN
jgi:hypothetical protein